MNWNDNLEGVHRDIAATGANPIRVMAGPGTGKSYAMKRRLMRLLSEGQNPRKILAVTFTRNAAADIVKDILNLGIDGCEKIAASTLHSFCFRLLTKSGVLQWSKRVPRPLITFADNGFMRYEMEPLLKDLDLYGEFGDLREKTKRVRAFESAWARLQTQDPGQPQSDIDRQFLKALISWLQFHEAMLIGEVVPEALRFIENNPASEERPVFDHVVVDEYQDLNKAEQVLLSHIATSAQYAIFGDEDQSIYSFRYAHPEGIRNFAQDKPTTQDHSLQVCQRCPVLIVNAANNFISQNHEDTHPRLVPKEGKPQGIFRIVQWSLPGDEAKGIARYVKHLIDKKSHKPGEILILSPRRVFAYAVRDALKEKEVPVHSFFHEEALEPKEAQHALAILTILTTPTDRVALRFLLGCKSPSWETRGYSQLRKHCETNGIAPWDLLVGLSEGTINKIPHTTGVLKRFEEIRQEMKQYEGCNNIELVNQLFPTDAKWADEFRAVLLSDEIETVDRAEILDRLQSHVSQPTIPDGEDFVQIMSLHKSKGLSRRAVIVIGCLEGLISNRYAQPTDLQRDEERRLFYVALTRCTESLVLSSFAKMLRKEAYAMHMQATTPGKGEYVGVVASNFLSQFGKYRPATEFGNNTTNES